MLAWACSSWPFDSCIPFLTVVQLQQEGQRLLPGDLGSLMGYVGSNPYKLKEVIEPVSHPLGQYVKGRQVLLAAEFLRVTPALFFQKILVGVFLWWRTSGSSSWVDGYASFAALSHKPKVRREVGVQTQPCPWGSLLISSEWLLTQHPFFKSHFEVLFTCCRGMWGAQFWI